MNHQSNFSRSERGYGRSDGKQGTEPVDNPKHFAGMKKLLLSVLPWRVIWEVALAMLEGALKYGAHNYRAAGQIRASTYFNGTMRHMTSWWEGEDMDPDTDGKIHHVVKAIASNLVIRDAMLNGNFIDDRPPRISDDFIKSLNETSVYLLKKFPEPVPPYTQVDLTWVRSQQERPETPSVKGSDKFSGPPDVVLKRDGDAV
jgi:hypothetical protein